LKVDLAIEEDEYVRIPSMVSKAGVKVGIFPFGVPSDVEDDGYDVMPGQSTSIRLTPVRRLFYYKNQSLS
jgi:hypothetical protein